MDIIIHGKPFDSSQCYTSSIDEKLAKKIIEEFFAIGIGTIKEPESLIVDARYWQGAWMSVYTLLLSVKDTAKRDSYFAISLVLPQKYCCLISEVYYLLEKVVRENVLGVYLDTGLKYITSNFEDSIAFEKLCNKLQTSYKNLEKNFDNSFQPRSTFSNDAYCSIYDCDSLALIDQLKTKGRIIVTENTATKDALASQSAKYQNAAQKAQMELQAKGAKVSELESRIVQMEEAAKQANSSVSGKVSKLTEKIAKLETENKQLGEDKKNVENALQELNRKVEQATAILDVPQPTPVSGRRNALTNKNHPDKEGNKPERTNIRRFLPMANTFMLLIVLGLVISLKECSGDSNVVQDEVELYKSQLDDLKALLAQKKEENDSLYKNYQQLYEENGRLNSTIATIKESINRASSVAAKGAKSNNSTGSKGGTSPKKETPQPAQQIQQNENESNQSTNN